MKRVLVYGGNGALGGALVRSLKSDQHFVASVGSKPSEVADVSILYDPAAPNLPEQATGVLAEIKSKIGDHTNPETPKFDAIISAAGGFAGGSLKSKDYFKNV